MFKSRKKKISDRLKDRNITIKYTPKVLEFLVNKGTSQKNGARFLKRVIQKNIEDKISLMIVGQETKNTKTIKITKKGDGLSLIAV